MAADPSITDGVRVAIFDLDGTLYQGDGFLPTYLEELEARGGLDREAARAELQAIFEQRHAARIGDFYDPVADRLLRAPAWHIEAVVDWQGEPVEDDRVGQAVAYDDGFVYLGDAWQAVGAVATHHQVDVDAREGAFRAVRDAINTSTDVLLDTSALASVLDEVDRFEHRFVMTNTPEPLARALVTAMGLPERFDGIRFGAGKPAGLERWLAELTEQLGVSADEILCVGDNYFNDILPAVRSGCRAIWVDPFGTAPHAGPETRVSGLGEVAPLLRD